MTAMLDDLTSTTRASRAGTARPSTPADTRLSPLEAAIARSRGWCQEWWARIHGPTPWLVAVPDIGPTCEVLLADALFHDLSDEEREGMLAWVRAEQHEDGGWRNLDGELDLSLTCLGYWARIQGGEDPQTPELVRALRLIHELGGARKANLTVRLWLALADTVPWSWIPAVPAELYLLPEFLPLSPARLSPWARQMVNAFHLMAESKARIHLYPARELLLLRDGELIPPRLTSPGLAGDMLQAFDQSIKLTRALPRGVVHRRSLNQAMIWLEGSQQRHGGWFSARPTLYSLLALRVAGAHSNDPRLVRGLAYLRRARGQVEAGGAVHLAQGLSDRPLAKVARLGRVVNLEQDDHETGEALRTRVLAAELAHAGPWQRRADAPVGGWPNEERGHRHLDLRATCSVLATLRSEPARTPAVRASLRRAAEVLLAMQERDGSFARFERGESDVPLSRLPWRDADQLNLGAPRDSGKVVLTAMVIRELASLGWRREDDRVARGLDWLFNAFEHEAHGWSVSTLAGVVRAFAAHLPPTDERRAAAEQALRKRQWEDGSFGDELSTARALITLLELQPRGVPCVQCERAARQLVGRVGLLARERASVPGASFSAPLPGYGLSPRLRDPGAGVRDLHLALVRFAERTRKPKSKPTKPANRDATLRD